VTGATAPESVGERLLALLMLATQRLAFAGLAAGLIIWLAAPAAPAAAFLLRAGLIGLIALPLLRLLAAIAAAARAGDRILLFAALAVAAILLALTLRDAASVRAAPQPAPVRATSLRSARKPRGW
jgi:hypothetical protein